MKTVGEQRVRIDFNVSGSDKVAEIKRKAAELINLVEAIDSTGSEELERIKYLASYQFEDGAMWAVKAATYDKG